MCGHMTNPKFAYSGNNFVTLKRITKCPGCNIDVTHEKCREVALHTWAWLLKNYTCQHPMTDMKL